MRLAASARLHYYDVAAPRTSSAPSLLPPTLHPTPTCARRPLPDLLHLILLELAPNLGELRAQRAADARHDGSVVRDARQPLQLLDLGRGRLYRALDLAALVTHLV